MLQLKALKFDNKTVYVDAVKTATWYASLPSIAHSAHCGCEDCCVYVEHIKHVSPELQAFFTTLGLDPTKEAEVWCANPDELYYVADYHVSGEIKTVSELDWFTIGEASIGITNITTLPSAMIPTSFTLPLLEIIIKLSFRSGV